MDIFFLKKKIYFFNPRLLAQNYIQILNNPWFLARKPLKDVLQNEIILDNKSFKNIFGVSNQMLAIVRLSDITFTFCGKWSYMENCYPLPQRYQNCTFHLPTGCKSDKKRTIIWTRFEYALKLIDSQIFNVIYEQSVTLWFFL